MAQPSKLKNFFIKAGSGTKRVVKKAGMLGLILLGACAGNNIRGPGPFERVALGKDVRAASLTFAPSGESNPTEYAVMGIVRDLEGRIHASPYFGHFEKAKDGNTFWKLEYIPNAERLDDPASNIFNLGIGESFLGGKLNVGGGVSVLGEEFTKQVAAALKLDPSTKITYSANVPEFSETGRMQLSHEFGRVFNGPAFAGFLERDFGEKSWKIGASIEAGDYGAIDGYYNFLKKSFGLQYAEGFGPKSEHFWFIGLEYDPINKEPTFFLGVNFTNYGGRSSSPRRRRGGKGNRPMKGAGPDPLRITKRMRIPAEVARALLTRRGPPIAPAIRKAGIPVVPHMREKELMRTRKAVEQRMRQMRQASTRPAKPLPGRRALARMRRR